MTFPDHISNFSRLKDSGEKME